MGGSASTNKVLETWQTEVEAYLSACDADTKGKVIEVVTQLLYDKDCELDDLRETRGELLEALRALTDATQDAGTDKRACTCHRCFVALQDARNMVESTDKAIHLEEVAEVYP